MRHAEMAGARPRGCVATAGGPCAVRRVASLQCTGSSVDTSPPAQPRQASQDGSVVGFLDKAR